MAKKSPYMPLPFPLGGVSEHGAFSAQEPGTCVSARNVRGYDPRTGRLRGAQRAGHARVFSAAIGSGNLVQHLTHVATSKEAATGSSSVRTVTGIAVANGNVYTWTTGNPAVAASGSSALSASASFIHSAVAFGKVYFADGASEKVLDISSNTVSAWTASAGALPVNGTKRPRLIANFRSRIVVSGLVGDGHNWFMSKAGDPTDWDYSPGIISATMAVAGNNTEAGLCPDIINALIPYRDDLLWFGCDSSIWQMTNDPAAGGSIDLITDVTGIAFGRAWCKDPVGVVYFVGSRGGLYAMAPGAQPQRLSAKRLDERLGAIDLANTKVMLEWDDRTQSVMIYATPLTWTSSTTATHYVYDTRVGAFWIDDFSDPLHNPASTHVFDGDLPGDRCVLLGGRDGVIRKIDYAAANDDSEPIRSSVWLGPLIGGDSEIRLSETRMAFASGSSPVAVELYRGVGPEAAFSSKPFNSFVHDPSHEFAHANGAKGSAIYIRVTNDNLHETWAYESGTVRVTPLGLHTGRRV